RLPRIEHRNRAQEYSKMNPMIPNTQQERKMNQIIRNTQQETNMTPDTISHSVRSRPDELVPSRYAVQVGEIEVLVVSDGVLPLPTAMLGHNAEPAARAAWMHDMFLPSDAFD